ncbi:mobilization protein, partial [Escherichia coli]
MRYPWNGSVSWKYRNAHWMALRWDGETMKNG